MTSLDPVTTASQLATAYTQAMQSQITTRNKAAQDTSNALAKLQSALQSFDAALARLSGSSGLAARSASFDSTAHGIAVASSAAQPGVYPIHVEQLASAHQVLFTDLPAVPVPMSGMLDVVLADGTSFTVDFSDADLDADGMLSQSEIARAINRASGNDGKVSAMVIAAGATTQMILSSRDTGESGRITLDASGLSGSPEAGVLAARLAAGTEISAARDAVVYIGAKIPETRIQQASNTFTAIPGVSMTFTAAMNPADPPIMLTIAEDASGTAANVKGFVDAWNELKKTLDDLTRVGDPASGTASAPFASDASVRALRNRLNDLLRQSFDGQQLAQYGIRADRSGTLSLDASVLQEKLAATPGGLDRLFGSTGLATGSGLLGALDGYLDRWTDTVDGQIRRRRESIETMQAALTRRQERLDRQYESAYQRYLMQFTQLQALQARMSETSSVFDSVWANGN